MPSISFDLSQWLDARCEDAGHATPIARSNPRLERLACGQGRTGVYGRLVEAITAQAASAMESGLSAEAAATVIAKAVTARKPRTR